MCFFYSEHDGELKEYKHVKSGKKISFVQDYLTYADSGGAYLFEPESDAKSVRSKKIIKLQLLSNGLHVKEVRQVFSPRVSQVRVILSLYGYLSCALFKQFGLRQIYL